MTTLPDDADNRGISRINEVLAAAISHAPVKDTGKDSYQTLCPSHPDKNPSLSITLGSNEKILIKCHAGCDYRSVLEAYGLPTTILFPPNDPIPRLTPVRALPNSSSPKVTARYEYLDKAGDVAYRIKRLEPKTFLAEPRGLSQDDRVLYRLPQLLEAAASEVTIYVAEGERDIDRLVQEGHVATTNPFGAASWLPRYGQYFAGAKRVEIIADHDEAGAKWAKSVAESLAGIVEDVTLWVYNSGKKGADVSDLFDAGLGLADLVPLELSEIPLDLQTIEGAREARIREIDLGLVSEQGLAEMTPPSDPLVQGVINQASTILLYGASGSGKSYAALDLAYSIACLNSWHSHPVAKSGVMIIPNERRRTWARRAEAWRKHHKVEKIPENVHYLPLRNRARLEPLDADAIVEACLTREIKLVIFDTLRASTDGNENDSDAWVTVEQSMARCTDAGIAVMVIHHTGKDPTKGARGSSAIYATVDTAIFVSSKAGTITLSDRAPSGKQADELSPDGLSETFRLFSVEGTTDDFGMTQAVLLPSKSGLSDKELDLERKIYLVDEVVRSLDLGKGSTQVAIRSEYNRIAGERKMPLETNDSTFRRLIEKAIGLNLISQEKKGKPIFTVMADDYDD